MQHWRLDRTSLGNVTESSKRLGCLTTDKLSHNLFSVHFTLIKVITETATYQWYCTKQLTTLTSIVAVCVRRQLQWDLLRPRAFLASSRLDTWWCYQLSSPTSQNSRVLVDFDRILCAARGCLSQRGDRIFPSLDRFQRTPWILM